MYKRQVLITAIGVSYFLENAALLIFGADTRSFTNVVTLPALKLAGGALTISGTTIVTFLACVVIMAALMLFIKKTKAGQAMLAVSAVSYTHLNEVGLLPEHLTRYPHEFSGGQRQRIGLARAMVMEPELVVADEPISALDVSIRAQVLNLLKKFQREKDLTYLFIAHDLSIVRFISDRIAVIYKGDIVEIADAEELFNFPLHPYTHSLISAIPIPDPQLEKNKVLFTYDPVSYTHLIFIKTYITWTGVYRDRCGAGHDHDLHNVRPVSYTHLCVFLTLLLVSQLHYEKRIQKFVLRNEEELTEFTKNYLAVEQRERRHMFEEWKEENGYSVQLTGLFPENVVAFYMGGFGLAPSSVYYGFYYSPEDIPVGTGEGQLVKAEGDNAGWSWQGYGDNGGEIRKIKPHWYYYKCWF